MQPDGAPPAAESPAGAAAGLVRLRFCCCSGWSGCSAGGSGQRVPDAKPLLLLQLAERGQRAEKLLMVVVYLCSHQQGGTALRACHSAQRHLKRRRSENLPAEGNLMLHQVHCSAFTPLPCATTSSRGSFWMPNATLVSLDARCHDTSNPGHCRSVPPLLPPLSSVPSARITSQNRWLQQGG